MSHFNDDSHAVRSRVLGKFTTRLRRVSACDILCSAFSLFYLICFWENVNTRWFSPHWTTDDSFQQVFPFHSVYHPQIFANDLIATMMKCYMAPLHYAIGYALTLLTRDPVMTAHWMMFIQLSLTMLFLYLAVRHVTTAGPALLAAIWFLHTRTAVNRLTGGLPRGWTAPLLAAFINFALRSQHKAVLAAILVGALLNPMATLMMTAAYGMYLSWKIVFPQTRPDFLRPFIEYIVVALIVAAVTIYITKVPPEIGRMYTYSEAAQMPEYSSTGRFPFVPLRPVLTEIRQFGFHPFISWAYHPAHITNRAMPFIVIAILISLPIAGFFKKRRVLDAPMYFYLGAVLLAYAAARIFAFRLYLPDRYLQLPLALFLIVVMTCGMWRIFHRGNPRDSTVAVSWRSMLALFLLGGLVCCGSGTGLYGTANFDSNNYDNQRLYDWIQSNIPETALMAGHPRFMNPIPLFAMRRAFVTTETAHPFFNRYYEEMSRRINVVLHAYYSSSLQELADICSREQIDYFIFERRNFYPPALAEATFFSPFDSLVTKLTSERAPDQYAYRQLPLSVDVTRYPFMPFEDPNAAVIDIQALKKFLTAHGTGPRE